MAWRAIQDTVPHSESLAAVTAGAERLYWRMVASSDPWGRLEGSPRKVRAKTMPLLRCSDNQVERWMDELINVDRIFVYKDETRAQLYVQIVDFDANQPAEFLRKRGASKYPEPPAKPPHSGTRPDKGGKGRTRAAKNGIEENGIEENGIETTPSLALAKRSRDELWDTLVEILGDVQTDTERGRRNRALKDLRKVGATPDEIRAKCGAYQRRYPNVDLTAMALVANWSQLDRPLPRGSRKLTAADTMAIARGERQL